MNNPFKYPGFRILTVFFDEPYREFHLREVAETSEVSPSTAKRFLDFYEASGFLVKERKANLVLFQADLENNSFRFMKVALFLLKVRPLTDFLAEAYAGSSIVLYGSCARGEDGPESDVDLLAVGRRAEKMDLTRYEDLLGRRINVIAFDSQEWEEKAEEDKAFYERILVDGIVLKGTLPVVSR
jgi:Predicted nucleotidyltransferases